VVFIDIKGAFNKVKKGNLYKVFKDKGLSKNIIKWSIDFISLKTVTPKKGGISGTLFKLDNSLP